MAPYGPPEKVHMEFDWYDGPLSGIANVDGRPHYFESRFDEANDTFSSTFAIWPIDAQMLALEVEQWRIFVDWNAVFEAGRTGVTTHPAHGGINPRWGVLQGLLKTGREVPADARKARCKLIRIERDQRYSLEGPDYLLSWYLLPESGARTELAG